MCGKREMGLTAGVLLSVFAMALMGGVHCAAMCGGIAIGAESARGGAVAVTLVRRRRDWLIELLAMHAGRVTMYMLLGAMLGAVGATAWKAGYLPLQRWMFGAGSVLLIVSGLRLLR